MALTLALSLTLTLTLTLTRYEHAFHDYTQFSDVYDTTLDIELSPDK